MGFILRKIDSDIARHNIYESAHDWWFTDYFCGETKEGIHKGFDAAVNQFTEEMRGKNWIPISNDYYEIAMIDSKYRDETYSVTSLDSLIEYAKNNPGKVKFRITGHSLGGAEAQVYTYRLLEEGVNKHDLCTYTFASPVPFTSNAIISNRFADVEVYNFINVRDFVPKYGVTLADHWFGSFVNTVGSEAGNALLMALYQSQVNDNAMPGGFVLGGSNLGYNVYVEGRAADGIGAEHDFSTYMGLLKNDDTTYKIIYTRPTIQRMNQASDPYELIGIYLDAMGLNKDAMTIIYGFLEGITEKAIENLIGEQVEEIAKIRFEFNAHEWERVPVYSGLYTGDKMPNSYEWKYSAKATNHTIYAEDMAPETVQKETIITNDGVEAVVVRMYDINGRELYLDLMEYLNIYYMCITSEPVFNTIRLDDH